MRGSSGWRHTICAWTSDHRDRAVSDLRAIGQLRGAERQQQGSAHVAGPGVGRVVDANGIVPFVIQVVGVGVCREQEEQRRATLRLPADLEVGCCSRP